MTKTTTKNPVVAIERCALALGWTVPKADGKAYPITVPGSGMGPSMKSKWDALAFLADVMMRRKLDPSTVGYEGLIPISGLAAWETKALRWLARDDTPIIPPKLTPKRKSTDPFKRES